VILAAVFAGVVGGIVWWQSRSDSVYRPGVDRSGLTAELARELPTDHPTVIFTDVTRSAGIEFRHFDGRRSTQLPEDMGSGAAWGDYDQDGWIDLFVVNLPGPIDLGDSARAASPARSTLFHNDGDGTFSDVTRAAGIDFHGWGMGAAWADYDNDGRLDLLITGFGRNALYHNEGGGRFSDQSHATGIGADSGFWAGASWGDYDRDGWLDLYVTGYVQFEHRSSSKQTAHGDIDEPASINPSSFRPERNLLFHNERGGRFRELANRAGVADTAGRSLSATWADLDEDGWPDLYVANDVSDNVLYHNLGDGTFEDVSHAARVADYRGAMGIATGDWDGDGDQDLVVTHWLAQENALYDNLLTQLRARAPTAARLPLTFVDAADRHGLGQIALDFVGWATSFFDYDNDGRLDLLVINGSTLQEPDDPSRLVPMRSQLFWNRGPDDGFFDVSPVAGDYFGERWVGRGAAIADYDNDGDLDLFVVNHGGPGKLLRNDGGNARGWLQVELRGARSNRQGIGAKLRLVANGVVQVRQVGVQSSYLSQNSPIESFGLGSAARVDSLIVIWTTGARQALIDLPPNQRIVVSEIRDTANAPGLAADRSRVLAFWTEYRAASARRIAGDPAGAERGYARALALDPTHGDALYYSGAMRLALGDYHGAEHAWQRLVTADSTSARAHSALGRLYLCLDPGAPFDLDRGEAALRLAHAINREETGAVLELGIAALIRGDTATARRRLREVLGSHRSSSAALFFSGYLEWAGGRGAAAAALARRAIAARDSALSRAPAPGEGDTKRGTALTDEVAHCDQLDRLESELAAGSDPLATYSKLDRLLRAARTRARG